MENQKKYAIISIIIFIGLILMIFLLNKEVDENNNVVNETILPEQTEAELKEEKVSGYHLVTYAQSSNSNSFIKSITVNASNAEKIKFVIGEIDKDSVVQERTSFEIACQQGENTFDLSNERYLIKEGEYLFMDLYGQDILYTQDGSKTKSLLQNENNKVSGKMIMAESNYILPFQYTLEEVEEYNVLAIGNDITIKNGEKGLDATDDEHDYYHITKTRLENTFDKVNMNCINATSWENDVETRKNWVSNNLKKDSLTNLDLIILQLGDNYSQEDELENDVKELTETLRKYSPNAEIVWVGVWNTNEKIINQLPTICERLNIEFVNISDISLITDYQSIVNETTENNETISAIYPNNEAMQIISNRIIEVLKFDF
jgi:hypothetical protein